MTNSAIRCPVCRARQEPQPQCRRCDADLALYCQALEAADRTAAALLAARQRGDGATARAQADYLNWLSPRMAATLNKTPTPSDWG